VLTHHFTAVRGRQHAQTACFLLQPCASHCAVAVTRCRPARFFIKQEEIIHEAQTMKSYNHPNVLPLYTSFVHGQDLWMVTPFMSGGSVLHIMKYQHPEARQQWR
jgi:Protein tyrosine and serine/threonine kinase